MIDRLAAGRPALRSLSLNFAGQLHTVAAVLFLSCIATAAVCYLLGSIPTGFLVGKARGMDIRSAGSGNIGATNAFRLLGKPAGAFVLLVDALKGYAAAAWLGPAVARLVGINTASELQLHQLVGGIGAVLGHNYTVWLGFKGGKGIATSGGAYLALAPLAVGIALVTWIVVVLITRYVSVGSIMAALALAGAVWATGHSVVLGIVTTGLSGLAIYKHRNNIQRLRQGTENRIGKRRPHPEGAK